MLTKSAWLPISGIFLIAVGAIVVQHGRRAPPDPKLGGHPRIISLAPNVTEIVFALGAGNRLVGVTDQCTYPPEAQRIEQVSGFGAPNVEKLLALSPDLVIASGLERPEIADVLRSHGIHVLEIRIKNFDELFEAIGQVGLAVDKNNEAVVLRAALDERLRKVEQEYAAIPKSQRPTVFVQITDDPLMTAGGSSFLDDMIHRAGGINVAHDVSEDYPRINPEKVIAWNPDFIVTVPMGESVGAIERISRRPGWGRIAAVENHRVIADIHPDLLFRPGPRLVEGVAALAARLHEKK